MQHFSKKKLQSESVVYSLKERSSNNFCKLAPKSAESRNLTFTSFAHAGLVFWRTTLFRFARAALILFNFIFFEAPSSRAAYSYADTWFPHRPAGCMNRYRQHKAAETRRRQRHSDTPDQQVAALSTCCRRFSNHTLVAPNLVWKKCAAWMSQWFLGDKHTWLWVY